MTNINYNLKSINQRINKCKSINQSINQPVPSIAQSHRTRWARTRGQRLSPSLRQPRVRTKIANLSKRKKRRGGGGRRHDNQCLRSHGRARSTNKLEGTHARQRRVPPSFRQKSSTKNCVFTWFSQDIYIS